MFEPTYEIDGCFQDYQILWRLVGRYYYAWHRQYYKCSPSKLEDLPVCVATFAINRTCKSVNTKRENCRLYFLKLFLISLFRQTFKNYAVVFFNRGHVMAHLIGSYDTVKVVQHCQEQWWFTLHVVRGLQLFHLKKHRYVLFVYYNMQQNSGEKGRCLDRWRVTENKRSRGKLGYVTRRTLFQTNQHNHIFDWCFLTIFVPNAGFDLIGHVVFL